MSGEERQKEEGDSRGNVLGRRDLIGCRGEENVCAPVESAESHGAFYVGEGVDLALWVGARIMRSQGISQGWTDRLYVFPMSHSLVTVASRSAGHDNQDAQRPPGERWLHLAWPVQQLSGRLIVIGVLGAAPIEGTTRSVVGTLRTRPSSPIERSSD